VELYLHSPNMPSWRGDKLKKKQIYYRLFEVVNIIKFRCIGGDGIAPRFRLIGLCGFPQFNQPQLPVFLAMSVFLTTEQNFMTHFFFLGNHLCSLINLVSYEGVSKSFQTESITK
jgi:hypothetical protein